MEAKNLRLALDMMFQQQRTKPPIVLVMRKTLGPRPRFSVRFSVAAMVTEATDLFGGVRARWVLEFLSRPHFEFCPTSRVELEHLLFHRKILVALHLSCLGR